MGVSTAFFSYSRQDSEFALRLASDLRAAGANVWIDQLDIEIGQAWDHAIQSAINSCSIFIVVLSPHGIASSNVSDELSFALSQKKRIIPVVYRDCEIPLLLRRLHFIDFRTDYPESLRWLITALNVVLPGLNRKKRSAVRVFCSYSHEDEKLKKRLEQHLSPLVRQEIIEVWSDLRIDPGADWENEIGRNLDSADMVLLLVSPSFVSFPYCWGKELGRALARHEKGECLVVPIILRPVDWASAPFAKLQVLPPRGQPIVMWENRDQACLVVAEAIRKLVDSLTAPSLQGPP